MFGVWSFLDDDDDDDDGDDNGDDDDKAERNHTLYHILSKCEGDKLRRNKTKQHGASNKSASFAS